MDLNEGVLLCVEVHLQQPRLVQRAVQQHQQTLPRGEGFGVEGPTVCVELAQSAHLMDDIRAEIKRVALVGLNNLGVLCRIQQLHTLANLCR